MRNLLPIAVKATMHRFWHVAKYVDVKFPYKDIGISITISRNPNLREY
jgi:hypothetical protein